MNTVKNRSMAAGAVMLLATALVGCTNDSDGPEEVSYPTTSITFLSGFNPGGGIDLAINAVMETLTSEGIVNVPLNIGHLPGGSGLVASQDLAASKASDTDILQLTSISSLSASLQNPTDFQLTELRPVALLFQEYSTMYVRADSDLRTLQDVANRVKADPQSLVFAGGTLGSPSNLSIAKFTTELGVSFDLVPYLPLSGGETELALLGGHADVISGGLETMQFVEAGDFRALAISSEERVESAPDLPTYVEQGFDVVQGSWRGVFAPPQVPDYVIDFWVDALERAVTSDRFGTLANQYGWQVTFVGGADFGKWLETESQTLSEVLRVVGLL